MITQDISKIKALKDSETKKQKDRIEADLYNIAKRYKAFISDNKKRSNRTLKKLIDDFQKK